MTEGLKDKIIIFSFCRIYLCEPNPKASSTESETACVIPC